MNTCRNADRLSPIAASVLARLCPLVFVTGTVLAGVVAVLYFQERDHEAAMLRQQSWRRVERESEFIAGELDSLRSDVLYLSEQQLLKQMVDGEASARRALGEEYASFARRKSVYDQIRYLDTTGREVVRVNFREGRPHVVPDNELQAKANRYYFQKALALKKGEVFVSEFDLNVEHGKIERPLKPVLRIVTPVIDSAGENQGFVALNYSGLHLLDRLNALSLPGKTLLVNADGHYIHGPTPGDAWGWLLEHDRTFFSQFPSAWRLIRNQPETAFATSEGLFAYRRVTLSGDRRSTGGRAKTSTPAEKNSETLILISMTPAELQSRSSSKLLTQLSWMYLGAMALLVMFGWIWARSAAIRKLQAESIQQSEFRLRVLSDKLLTAQEEERRSISRELHDELGQQITAIRLDLRSAANQADAARRDSLLQRAIEETDHLLESVHETVSRVRPSVLDDLGLRDAVVSLAEEVRQRRGLKIETELNFDDADVSAKVADNIYRILQEGLVNVVKHAQADHAWIVIEKEPRGLKISLADNGVGFDPRAEQQSRLGVLGMRERAELLGGVFQISERSFGGTRIQIQIPFENASS